MLFEENQKKRMETFRYYIGMPSTKTAAPVATRANLEERQDILLKRQQQQLQIDQANLEDTVERMTACIKAGRSAEAKRHMQDRNRLEQNIRIQQGKIENLMGTQSILANADENLTQAEIMKHGAGELAQLQKQTEAIDIDDVMDTLQDGHSQTSDYSARLAAPFHANRYGGESEETGMAVDDELELLMQQAADERLADFDNAPVSEPIGKTKVTPEPTTLLRRKAQK